MPSSKLVSDSGPAYEPSSEDTAPSDDIPSRVVSCCMTESSGNTEVAVSKTGERLPWAAGLSPGPKLSGRESTSSTGLIDGLLDGQVGYVFCIEDAMPWQGLGIF